MEDMIEKVLKYLAHIAIIAGNASTIWRNLRTGYKPKH